MYTNNFSGKFVIINTKKTPIDDISRRRGVRIYDKPLNFLYHLFEDLKIEKEEIPCSILSLELKDKIITSFNQIIEKKKNSGFFDSVPNSDDIDSMVLDIVSPRKRRNQIESDPTINITPKSPFNFEKSNDIDGVSSEPITSLEKSKFDLKSEIFKELEEEKELEIEEEEIEKNKDELDDKIEKEIEEKSLDDKKFE